MIRAHTHTPTELGILRFLSATRGCLPRCRSQARLGLVMAVSWGFVDGF